jgi:hypothetical protein
MPQTHDNGGTRVAEQPREIRETLLMADVAGHPERTPEAEPVLVQTCGDTVALVDDDGRTAVYSRRELLAALGQAA